MYKIIIMLRPLDYLSVNNRENNINMIKYVLITIYNSVFTCIHLLRLCIYYNIFDCNKCSGFHYFLHP